MLLLLVWLFNKILMVREGLLLIVFFEKLKVFILLFMYFLKCFLVNDGNEFFFIFNIVLLILKKVFLKFLVW